jgi:hypothetical protein
MRTACCWLVLGLALTSGGCMWGFLKPPPPPPAKPAAEPPPPPITADRVNSTNARQAADLLQKELDREAHDSAQP